MADPVNPTAPPNPTAAPVAPAAAPANPNTTATAAPVNPNPNPPGTPGEATPQTGKPAAANPTVNRNRAGGTVPRAAITNPAPAPISEDDGRTWDQKDEVNEDDLPQATRDEMEAGRTALGKNRPGANTAAPRSRMTPTEQALSEQNEAAANNTSINSVISSKK